LPQLVRQLQAARWLVPEQIVRHEPLVANRRHVLTDGVDGPQANGARVQLPDGAKGTSEWTSPRRLDEPRGAVGEARILLAPAIHMMAGRKRHVVKPERAGVAGGARDFASRMIDQRQPGDGRGPAGVARRIV